MNQITRVLRTREGGAVKRVHTIPWIGDYTVSQHTYGMLMLLDVLYPRTPGFAIIQRILWHDVHERWTGDVPAGLRFFKPEVRENFKHAEAEVQVKFKFPLETTSYNDKLWIRALDQLEFLLSCYDQRALGNQNVEQYIKDVREWFKDNNNVPEPVLDFVDNFKWSRTNQRTEEGQKLGY